MGDDGSPPSLDGIRSQISRSFRETVLIHGYDLVGDLLGKANLGDLAFLELFRRLPTDGESVVFNSVLVSLVEHGTTPSSISARLTYLGAPESLQGAVAAGLLGLGSTFAGTIEESARMLQQAGAELDLADDSNARRRVALDIVEGHLGAGTPIPGVGHSLHRPVDPRAERLFAIARENGLDDANEILMREIAQIAADRLQKPVPVNVTGAIGAIASTMGLRWQICRGLAVASRAVGLVGHLLEEFDHPIAGRVWRATRHAAESGES